VGNTLAVEASPNHSPGDPADEAERQGRKPEPGDHPARVDPLAARIEGLLQAQGNPGRRVGVEKLVDESGLFAMQIRVENAPRRRHYFVLGGVERNRDASDHAASQSGGQTGPQDRQRLGRSSQDQPIEWVGGAAGGIESEKDSDGRGEARGGAATGASDNNGLAWQQSGDDLGDRGDRPIEGGDEGRVVEVEPDLVDRGLG